MAEGSNAGNASASVSSNQGTNASANGTNANLGNATNSAEVSLNNADAQLSTSENTQSSDNGFDNFANSFTAGESQTGENQVEVSQESQEPQQQVIENYNLKYADGTEASDVNEIFKGVNLSQEQAEKLFGAYQEAIDKYGQQVDADLQQNVLQRKSEWYNEVLNDPEMGREHLEQTKSNLKKVVTRFGSSELSQFLNDSALGFNPHFVRFMNNVAGLLNSDNSFVNGQARVPSRAERLSNFYDKSPELKTY